MGAPTARQAQREVTADAVRKAALELFVADGFERTTVAKIAKRAGVATGTVLLHFGSKSELATAAFTDQIATLVEDAFTGTPTESLRADLRHVFTTLYDWYAANAPLSHELLRESLFSSGPWSDRYSAQVRVTLVRLAELTAAHQEAGRLPAELKPKGIAEGIFADYTLTLLAGVRRSFPSTATQTDHALHLVAQRLPAED